MQQPEISHKTLVTIIKGVELLIYVLIGALLATVALLSVATVVKDVVITSGSGSSLLALNGIFVTIIIAELLGTVVSYIQHRTINLKLILGAGITAMVRRLLMIGIEPIPFDELVIVLAAIVILIGGMRFISDISEDTYEGTKS